MTNEKNIEIIHDEITELLTKWRSDGYRPNETLFTALSTILGTIAFCAQDKGDLLQLLGAAFSIVGEAQSAMENDEYNN